MTDSSGFGDFGTFGRFVETPVAEMDPGTKSAYEYTLQLRGLVPGPHKIWVANPALSRTIVPTGAYFQTESSLTKAEIEIVTNVINGRWGAAYSNYEHERIGIEKGHLEPAQVAALIAGLPTSFADPRQQVAYELASVLAGARVVPVALFRRAKDLLGDKGIVDVTVLMGWFTAVSLTLMAYDVPSSATGLPGQ
jgi:4-carboxymuconolactone decarboxylase